VDYPTYLFTHAAPSEPLRETLKRIGPTLRLAVLTTVFGGLSMLLSSFTGLSQLGVLTVTGVLVAGMVTRWVLPALLPHPFTGTEQRRLPMNWTASVRRPAWGAKAVWVVMAAAVIGLLLNPTSLWDDDLAHLSPISDSAKALDKQLRSELGAPDVRHVLVISGESQEAVLVRSEAVAGLLRGLVNRNVLTGFDMASLYLPAQGTQLARRTALPDAARLQASLNQAVQGLPFREGLFVPFLRDIERAREGKLLEAEDLQGSALSMKIRGLLFQDGSEWIALAPLRGVEDEKELAAGIRDWGNPFVVLLDLKEESNRLIAGYRQQSLWLTGIGFLAIALVLWWGLRDVRQVGRVLTPVLIAVVLVVALLIAFGEQLTLFHLVSLLLVTGIGLNYALFFNRAIVDEADGQRTMLSLTVCSLCTLSAFGVLAWSQTPVLHAIGVTVGIGCVCSLMTSALLARRPHQAFA
jgi:predicted exporter